MIELRKRKQAAPEGWNRRRVPMHRKRGTRRWRGRAGIQYDRENTSGAREREARDEASTQMVER